MFSLCAMKKLFSLSTFLFFFSGVFLSQETVSLSSSGDVTSRSQSLLLSFKSSLPNPGVLHDWLPGQPPCSFSGVTCDGESRVSAVDLSSYLLGATNLSAVSAFLAAIEGLESLSLRSANLSGPISSFGSGVKCGSSLAAVDLSRNGLSGPISDAAVFGACPGLSELNLSSNFVEFGPSKERKEFGLRLKVLDLSLNKISGSNVIPWIFARDGCGEMTHLSLKGNKISGAVSFSGCKRLEYLDISSNNLSAVFASPLFGDCSAMRHLDLSGNKLAGDLSKAISGCSQLVFLNVSSNPFYAPIPSSFPSESLEFLSLSNNGFRGGFPTGLLSGCSSLVELDLSGNELSGSVPASLSSCAAMESIDLSKNNFTGEFPIGTFMKLKSLKSLGLSHNWFFGELPESVSEFPRLETLDLSSNNFTGRIPGGLCDTGLRNSLAELYLVNNLFTGTIPESLSNCSNLVSLDLSFNFLTGSIPRSFGSLTKLRDLILWLNNLTGEIPEVSEMRSLENLILDFNELTGSIPSGISNCTSINWISLSNNKLTGEIPKELGRLPYLAILKLSNNSLSGDIPAELGDCKSLIWLDLNTNSLTGIIPPELFKQSGHIAFNFIVSKTYVYIKNDGTKEECHGAGNLLEFAGIRQEQLNRVSTMNPCNFDFTRVYRGNIQPTFNHDGSMIFFDLSHNLLSGNIPEEIGKMRYLMILNLGHNDLTGSIPEELGESTNLNILDLSSNRLAGSIPPALSRLSMLMEIDLSNNLLTGLIPESSQFESFPAYRFANNTGLCGYPLPSCGSTSGKTGDSGRQKSHRQASLFGSVAMGLLFSLFCIFGFVIVLIEMRKRKRKRKEAGIDVYLDTSRSNSGTANVTWNLTGAREALNINLATFEKPLQKLTFADLLEATNGFHNDSLIGKGGFGDVYKAKLKDGRTVAIKKLIHISGQGDREFTAEMETIGKIKHRNLVPLLGYCKVGEERLLVYEFMKFGSLDDVLHDPKKSGIKLSWAARRKIAIGSARGLAFLHHNCNPHIIHRDMKSSNVLLDENLEARVSDFGMARLMSTMDTHLSVSTLAGTPGYVPPEYYQSFRCSTKGDVYSYGVVLLELLTGKQPTNSIDFGDNNLVGWVKQHAKLKISNVFDPELMKEDPSIEVELLQHLRVACACLDDRHWRRPTMIQVMAMFKEIQAGSGIDSQSTIATDDVVSSFGSVEMVGMSLKEVPELSKQ